MSVALFSSPVVSPLPSAWLRGIGLLVWAWLCLAFPVQARVLLRVGIAVNKPQVRLGSSAPARLLDAQGQPLAEVPAMQPLQASRIGSAVSLAGQQGERLYLQPTTPDGLVFIDQNWYRGWVELIPGESGVIAINQVGLEDYVSSVVGSEMGHRFPMEALKAQAVASRTYALYHRSRRSQQPFDLGSGIDWQVYKGVAAESNRTQAAARETAGQVLVHQGQLINAVFHSSGGGHTDDAGNVWLESRPYLQGVPDFDHHSPVFSWTATIPAQQLQQLAGGIGAIRSIEILRSSPWGRAITLRLVGSQGSKDVSGSEFRRALGLRSTMIAISPRGEAATTASLTPAGANFPAFFQIQGRGYGHGVGMSQWGAAALASQNYSYQQILSHYYRNTSLAVVEGR
ncbi:stage II sporulation protein D [Thermostichus sp. MS-CIW-21]|uniref:SpoIID/LytB domain-containing protein n=1 Tax=unclassified Synechococcus TaxID=2626047 RepID=UPI00059BFF4E|nr:MULTISPECIES: SpoIID/LytB domain-containing protein [unclassified Synechococcus]PIK86364.1 stage II sporulation protein SpoIID [Synechococcus sp. 63AY4M2]PIK89602.1 stage II sporulation protein SpoIID [Synechococcus sp. 65AY6A5]PIK91725.1 stage II sporulation protein SpoIID [Synechococcus sp. 65AY6Li]PIK97672.1 stage II sporulation protein SpoIID [Synechococcus sp. 63AY4M1]